MARATTRCRCHILRWWASIGCVIALWGRICQITTSQTWTIVNACLALGQTRGTYINIGHEGLRQVVPGGTVQQTWPIQQYIPIYACCTSQQRWCACSAGGHTLQTSVTDGQIPERTVHHAQIIIFKETRLACYTHTRARTYCTSQGADIAHVSSIVRVVHGRAHIYAHCLTVVIDQGQHRTWYAAVYYLCCIQALPYQFVLVVCECVRGRTRQYARVIEQYIWWCTYLAYCCWWACLVYPAFYAVCLLTVQTHQYIGEYYSVESRTGNNRSSVGRADCQT